MRASEGTQKSELLGRLFRSAARTGALFLGDGKVCCFDYPSFLPGERIAGLSIPSREAVIPAEETHARDRPRRGPRLPGGAFPVLACRHRQRFGVRVRPDTCAAGRRPTEVVGNTMQEQTRQSLRNVQTILKAAGSSLDRVVKVTVLLARPDLYKEMNEAYAEFFPDARPARSMVRFGADIPGVLVAIDAIALA